MWFGPKIKLVMAGLGVWRAVLTATFACCLSRCRVAHASRSYTVGFFLQPLQEEPRKSLEALARAVTDPTSEKYASYLTQQELSEAAGISADQINSTAAWIQQVLGVGSVVAHTDLITVPMDDWLPTYNFGKDLQLNFSDMPSEVSAGLELIVTPMAPLHLCKNLTNTSKPECEAAGPCSWVEDEDWRNCTGDSDGWICWKDYGSWRCDDTANMSTLASPSSEEIQHVDEVRVRKASGATEYQSSEHWERRRLEIWKQRRRGRAWDLSSPVDSWSMVEDSAANKTKVARFSVAPHSRSISLYTSPAKISWTSVEFSFWQLGEQRSAFLQPAADCWRYSSKTAKCRVNVALENLHPVDNMVICVDFSGNYTAPAGCTCENHSTLDGRKCTQLPGQSPEKDPIYFAMPTDYSVPAALREDLGIPAGLASASMSSQAVGEFNVETFSESDVRTSFELFGLDPSLINISEDTEYLAKVDLKENNAGEGSLDMQYLMALAPGAPTTWIGILDSNMDGFMLAYAAHLNNQSNPPLVHSISWGEVEFVRPPAAIKRLDYEFMKLALRGVSILISSGDNGINSGGSSCRFVPDSTSSEWVTLVGATMRSAAAAPYCSSPIFNGLGSCQERGQVVCSTNAGGIITSSGGFSMYRERPAYQDAAVSSYLSQVNLTQYTNSSVPCLFSNTGQCSTLGPMMASNRAFPDISGPGHMFPTIISGSYGLYDGTSASAPVVAAMITLLNAEQSRRGQPPLGALNTWLYQVYARAPHAFVDVTVGNNAATEHYQCSEGFSATPGWDPVTGLGVPLFNQLLELLPSRKMQTSASIKQPEQADKAKPSYAEEVLTSRDASGLVEASLKHTSFLVALLVAFCAGGVFSVSFVFVHRLTSWKPETYFSRSSRQPLL